MISAYQAADARAAVLEERRRLARDIHDGVAQELSFITSQMHGLPTRTSDRETAGEIMESVHRALDESRGAISALGRPVNEPLHVALARTAEEVAAASAPRSSSTSTSTSASRPPGRRRCRGSCARRWRTPSATATPRRSRVHLRDADGIWLRVTDDGAGFDATDVRSEASFGLIGMKERAESLGGDFKLAVRARARHVHRGPPPVSPSTRLRVVIADDHPYYRRGLARSLQSRGIEVVGEAPNGEAAIRAVEETGPDVVVMDLSMPGRLRPRGHAAPDVASAPSTRVVVLSVSNDEEDVTDAMLAGACGYVLKESPVDEMVAAIHAAASGEPHISRR